MNKAPKCVIHCRVSSAKQAYEGESLDVQAAICRSLAERNGWALAHKPWLEAFSGRKSTRPTFIEILEFLDRRPGRVKYYVFRSIDRFTRGGSLTYETMKRELRSRGVEMVDSNGVIQATKNSLEDVGFEYEWSRVSPSEIAETVLANTAKAEVGTILTRMIGQEIRLTRQGYKIRGPQDGYRNEKIYVEGKRRTIQVPDPERARFITAMFELRAAGEHSDAAIVEQLTAMGYRRPIRQRWDRSHQRVIGTRGGGALSVKRLQEIIQRPIYCGVVWEKWTNWLPVKAPYEGLVPIETYNAANRGKRYIRATSDGLELLHDFKPELVGQLKSRINPAYPLKNLIVCPTCRKPFMASASRSRNGSYHHFYHCARNHPRVAFRKADFEALVGEYLNNLTFDPDTVDLAAAALLERFREEKGRVRECVQDTERTVEALKAELDATVVAFREARSDVMRRTLEQKAEELEVRITQAEAMTFDMDISEADILEFDQTCRELMDKPILMLEEPEDAATQRSRFDTFFSESPSISEISSRTAKLSPFFWVCEGLEGPQSALVRLRELTWNQIHSVILRNKNEKEGRDAKPRSWWS